MELFILLNESRDYSVTTTNTIKRRSPFPAPHQNPHSPRPAGAVSASPSASWPLWLAAPTAASCGLSGSPCSPSAAESPPGPENNSTHLFINDVKKHHHSLQRRPEIHRL